MAAEHKRLPLSVAVPDADVPIVAAGIPDSYGAVLACAGDSAAVRAERDDYGRFLRPMKSSGFGKQDDRLV
jgi:hypothetical protein